MRYDLNNPERYNGSFALVRSGPVRRGVTSRLPQHGRTPSYPVPCDPARAETRIRAAVAAEGAGAG